MAPGKDVAGLDQGVSNVGDGTGFTRMGMPYDEPSDELKEIYLAQKPDRKDETYPDRRE